MRSGFRPRQQMPLPEPSPSLWRAMPISLSIVVTLILLPAIAFASPPDPSWIAGIYDGADGDDIVNLVYETSGPNAAALSHMPPSPCLTETLFESIVHCFPEGQSTRRPRSPPTIAPSRTFNSSTDYTATTSPSLTPAPAHPSASSVSPQEATKTSRARAKHARLQTTDNGAAVSYLLCGGADDVTRAVAAQEERVLARDTCRPREGTRLRKA